MSIHILYLNIPPHKVYQHSPLSKSPRNIPAKKRTNKDQQLFISLHKEIINQKINHCSRSQINTFKKLIQSILPDQSLPVIIELLYEHLLEKYEFDPEEEEERGEQGEEEKEDQNQSMRSKRSSCSSIKSYKSKRQNSVSSKGSIGLQVQYITEEDIPPIVQKTWPAYDPIESPFFDQVLPNESESSPSLGLRYKEKRWMVGSFIRGGYGLVNIQKDTKTQSKNPFKRYKTVLYSAMLSSAKSLQTFLIKAKGNDILTLKQIGFHFPSILINCYKYFPKKMADIFIKCLKTNFKFASEPVHRDEVAEFYQQFCSVVKMHNTKLEALEEERARKKENRRKNMKRRKTSLSAFESSDSDILMESVEEEQQNLKLLTKDPTNIIKVEQNIAQFKQGQQSILIDDLSDLSWDDEPQKEPENCNDNKQYKMISESNERPQEVREG